MCHLDRISDFITRYSPAYSSVPNRRAVRNKRAGGKIVSKSINVQTKIRPCRGKFFLKINKRADQNRTAVQDKIDVQGGKFSQNQ